MKTFFLTLADWLVGFLLVLWIGSSFTWIGFFVERNEPATWLWFGISSGTLVFAWILLELALPYRDDARPAMVRGQANEPTF